MSSSFESDLEYGKEAELRFEALLVKRDRPLFFVRSDSDKSFDLIMVKEGGPTVFEIKRDRMAEKTGNIAIELLYKNRNSGVMTTISNYTVYMIGETFYQITPDDLIRAVHSDKSGRFVYGGDNNDSLMWLMGINHFTKNAEEVVS